ncbi:MAG: hypothetical protein M0R39_05555 [Prolixibacteraceae bacterium]|nr:hypothetical protein [Prolixibacteraceae bacterium]
MQPTLGRGGTSVGLVATVNCLLAAFGGFSVIGRWLLAMRNVLPVVVISHAETFNALPVSVNGYRVIFANLLGGTKGHRLQ